MTMGTEARPVGSIVLVGFMGSGKSTIARQLAQRLQREAIDLDTLIEKKAGDSIAAFFSQYGEEEFRHLETAVLSEALNHAAILATGGGIVTRPENRSLLNSKKSGAERDTTYVVYLKAHPSTLAHRIRLQPGLRPLIDGEGVLDLPTTVLRITELLDKRSPHYEEVADIVIETDGRSTSQISEEIVARLRQATDRN